MKRKVIIFGLLVLMSIGLEYEMENLYFGEVTLLELGEYLSGLGLVVIYCIPLGLLMRRLWRQVGLSFEAGIITIMVGCFVSGWLAGEANTYIESLWYLALPNAEWLIDWNDALAAPFVEEILKCACALLVMYLIGERRLSAAFVIGMVIGFGFQLIEDLNYVLQAETITFEMAAYRAAGALSSHWMMTGVTTAGVWGLWLWYREKVESLSLSWLWVSALMPMGLHFIWNSPLGYLWVTSLVSAAIIYLWGRLYLTWFGKTEFCVGEDGVVFDGIKRNGEDGCQPYN